MESGLNICNFCLLQKDAVVVQPSMPPSTTQPLTHSPTLPSGMAKRIGKEKKKKVELIG